jgi:hypothetical protein
VAANRHQSAERVISRLHARPGKYGHDIWKDESTGALSPKNGILVAKYVEDHFDKGKIVIVPDLPAKLCFENVLTWLKKKAKGV